jgi:histidinol-phosphate aminotransferase
MPVSRRGFVRSLAEGSRLPAGLFLAARGHEAWVAEYGRTGVQAPASPADAIRLNSNENPLGPSAAARAAIEKGFAYAGRYPINSRPAINDFRALIATQNKLKPENVVLGAGSGELLECATQAFTSKAKGLVTASPSYGAPAGTARQIGAPVKDIAVDQAGKLDLEKMIAAATGSGLVFVCNPNNPTATVHSSKAITDLVTRIHTASPDTVILVDEAYHDYVTDPSYATAIPLVTKYPNVLVLRTLSKLHGMAGLRLGYAVGSAEVIAKLARWTMPFNANALAIAAATVSIQDEAQIQKERRRNTEAVKFTVDFFRSSGFQVTDSQANFIWVNLNRPAPEFREACQKQGILVGRNFPPLEKTHSRISIGTMEEMRKAVSVFRSVLGLTTTSAQSRR